MDVEFPRMGEGNPPHWQRVSQVFSRRAGAYDRWFDSSLVYAIERAALLEVADSCPHPRLEVGVGPGRFAADLAITFGVDPALGQLTLARQRHILVTRATGEDLPIRDGSMGTVFLLFTLCFLAAPRLVLEAVRRVLKPHGRLVVGMIPAESAWGKVLRQRADAGDPFYRFATFYDPQEVMGMLIAAGFSVAASRSTLIQPPGKVVCLEKASDGVRDDAGFVVLVAHRQ